MTKKILAATLVLSIIAAANFSRAQDDSVAVSNEFERGRTLAFERRKGNCLACHVIEGGELAGNYGPPLVLMKVRYPDRAKLREQIWDASIRDPNTRMPPFGRHKILTEEEIDLIVDFVLSL